MSKRPTTPTATAAAEENTQKTISSPVGGGVNYSTLNEVIYPVTEGVRSAYTKQAYKTSFNRFLNLIGIHDLRVLLDLGPKVVEQLIIKYAIHARDIKKLSTASIRAECNAIFHFFDINDVEINRKRVRRFFPSDDSVHDDRLYNPDEMQRIWAACSKRERVIILLMVSTGMRIGAISKLKVRHLEYLDRLGVYKITVDKTSNHDRYWTVCNTECATAIKDYLERRVKDGEGPIKDTSPLIREHRDPNDIFRMPAPMHVNDAAIRYTVRQSLKRSGVYSNSGKDVRMSHAFRKNFKTVCEASGMKSLHAEMLMGHHTGLAINYYRPKESDVIDDYMAHAADALTIDDNQRLKQENADLRMRQNAESEALWKKQKEQEARIKSLEDWLRTAGLMDSCD